MNKNIEATKKIVMAGKDIIDGLKVLGYDTEEIADAVSNLEVFDDMALDKLTKPEQGELVAWALVTITDELKKGATHG